MENMKQIPSQIFDEIKVAADEIKVPVDELKVAAEMGVTVTGPDILARPGHWLQFIGGYDTKESVQLNLEFCLIGGVPCQIFRTSLPIPRSLVGDPNPLENNEVFTPRSATLGRSAWKFIPVEIVKWFTAIDYVDLESGVKTEEVVCECYLKNECPKYVGYAHIERILKELKDKGNALKFIPVEMVKELKDEGYGLLCIPVDPVRGLKDDGHALKFIPVEAVKVSKDDGCALKFIPVEMVEELKGDGYALFIPVEIVKNLDEYNIKMESGGIIEAVVNKSWLKHKCIEYANDYIEKMAKPEMGLLFSGATMQNIYQLVTSGMVTTGKGKTLVKLNEAAFMFLLYGLVMPRRAARHVALAVGVAFASAAYLVTMSFAF